MSADLTAYLPLILIALALLAVLVWIISRTSRRARVTGEEGAPGIFRDVLEDGAAPAQRNQALIDAPRGIEIIQGELSAMANAQVTSAAPLGTDEEAGPAPDPAPAPAPAAAGPADDLTRIKGLGPKLAALLGEFGITTFAQIAAWTPEEIERIDARLGRFSGRINRDQWVEQARFLAAGDEAGFTARFGNNG
ncbi:helix-hairpin-helix domain-containing protein [Porphyrobacter sp. AAP82]|uniref:helix-hairpin-helix domain-containing protein n=1 Tax=Porphyrobacter sp. AAP82 TaxID=1248917 RepID=UPI0002E7A825|nr:helix-hairpin-helix domain-containing protein [Porphyrobacter sp. AAP82]